MKEPILRADREHRRRILLIFIVAGTLGALIVGWCLPWAEQTLARQNPETALRVLKSALVFVFLSVVALGLYLFRFGRSVLESERFPPPNHKVIRDTRLMQGREARTRGRVLVFLSLLLISIGLLGAFCVPHLLEELTRGSATQERANDSIR